MSKRISILVILVVIILTGAFYGLSLAQKNTEFKSTDLIAAQTKAQDREIIYKGKDGSDALILLKQIAKVEQDSSGLVISINGRVANAVKHEYWAFYINEKMAQVGPAEFKTKNSDKLTWKIEKY